MGGCFLRRPGSHTNRCIASQGYLTDGIRIIFPYGNDVTSGAQDNSDMLIKGKHTKRILCLFWVRDETEETAAFLIAAQDLKTSSSLIFLLYLFVVD